MRILAVPAVTPVVGEEAPRELVVLVLHEDAHAPSLARSIAHVLFPDDRQEQRSGRVHDRDVWEEPVTIVLLQHFDGTEEEWVLRYGTHSVIGDTGRCSAAYPGRISQERIQATVAALIDGVRNETPWSLGGILTSSRSMYVPPKCARMKYRIVSAR